MPPVIETTRLRLYPPRLEDLEIRLAMNRDPEVMRYIGPVREDIEAERSKLREVILSRDKAGGTFWHVALKTSPGFLGWCGLFPLEESGFIEIGYRYARLAWGQGIASEAARAALDHGFRVLEIDPIVAVTDPGNRGSQGVLEKIAGESLQVNAVFCRSRLSR